MKRPPITKMTHPLSFNMLSAADFERLCLWLVGREGYESAEALGEAGSEQGRDIVAYKNEQSFTFQCKRVKQFSAESALQEIEKIHTLPKSEQSDVLVFVVTCSVSVTARNKARLAWGNENTCRFWAGTELDEMAKRHPDILMEFFSLSSGDQALDGFSTQGDAYGLITIDTTPILGEKGDIWEEPFDQNDIVQLFLDTIYGSIRPKVPPYTYGRKWAVMDSNTGTVYRNLASFTSPIRGPKGGDRRKLSEIGFKSGMRLEVIALPLENSNQ